MSLFSIESFETAYVDVLHVPILLNLPVPIPGEEKKIKAWIKPFEAPQRSVKIKI